MIPLYWQNSTHIRSVASGASPTHDVWLADMDRKGGSILTGKAGYPTASGAGGESQGLPPPDFRQQLWLPQNHNPKNHGYPRAFHEPEQDSSLVVNASIHFTLDLYG